MLGIDGCRDNLKIDYLKKCREEPITEDSKYCFLEKRGNKILDPTPYINPRTFEEPLIKEENHFKIRYSLNTIDDETLKTMGYRKQEGNVVKLGGGGF